MLRSQRRTGYAENFGGALVGRARERALLREHIQAMHAGQGDLVLIGGEALATQS